MSPSKYEICVLTVLLTFKTTRLSRKSQNLKDYFRENIEMFTYLRLPVNTTNEIATELKKYNAYNKHYKGGQNFKYIKC